MLEDVGKRTDSLNLGNSMQALSSLELRCTELGRFILRAKQMKDLMALRLLYASGDSIWSFLLAEPGGD